jgi:hypothetical protein
MRLYGRSGQYSTIAAHMPHDHQEYLQWNGERFRSWAAKIGVNTNVVVTRLLASHKVEQQAYRSCMGLLKLADKYSPKMLEAACQKSLLFTPAPSYKSIKNILVTRGTELLVANESPSNTTPHGITRGAGYYRR